MSKILQKIKNLCRDKDEKLLKKHGIVMENSPSGKDCNGFSVEELTPKGEELLTQMAWTDYRPKVVELLNKVDESEKEEKREKKNK